MAHMIRRWMVSPQHIFERFSAPQNSTLLQHLLALAIGLALPAKLGYKNRTLIKPNRLQSQHGQQASRNLQRGHRKQLGQQASFKITQGKQCNTRPYLVIPSMIAVDARTHPGLLDWNSPTRNT